MKKFVSLLVSVAMTLSIATPAFATNYKNDVKITETDGVRTAVTEEDGYIYTAKNNMKTGMFSLTISSSLTGEVVRTVDVDLNNLHIDDVATMAAVAEQDTFSGYYYRIDRDSPYDSWDVRCPQSVHDNIEGRSFVDTYYIIVPYSPDNRDLLDDFKDAVEDLDDSEKEAISSAGLALVLEYLAIVVASAAGGPIGVGVAEVAIASIPGLATYKTAIDKMNDDMNNCYYKWRNIWKYAEY